MTPVVSDEIGGLVSGPQQFRMRMEKDGGLNFPGVHVGEQRGGHSGPFPSRFPVLHRGEQRHPLTARGGLLNDIAQYVISAVPVDHHQGVHAGTAERIRYVPNHRMKGHRGDADGPRPRRVLVRAGDRHRGKEVHRIRLGDLPGDRARHQRVRGQRQEGAVLFEAAHGKDGDLP
ncbi:hypothetical protein Stsp02_42560 [Streptomyces sp. NBRC 14336]|nr:hypothetical protein Stsp02_42560 [Streptomyces sp. NBRC 14336]